MSPWWKAPDCVVYANANMCKKGAEKEGKTKFEIIMCGFPYAKVLQFH